MTILERSATLLSREEPRVGDLIAARLRADGVDVRTRVQATGARRDGADTVVTLDDSTEARCDVVVVGAGRKLRTAGLGLDTVGVRLGEKARDPGGRALPGRPRGVGDRRRDCRDAVHPRRQIPGSRRRRQHPRRRPYRHLPGHPPEWCSPTPRSPRSG
ncbi:MAG TPA: FAD-dependent oxidoreductase [Micromonosporaceae bacterium]|nr:FAD-dependent oxidoreductase [Micromonosporaceae bacterium]